MPKLPTAEATMLILPSGAGITEVPNCPYCNEAHTHGRIYGEANKRFPGCCKKSYRVKVTKVTTPEGKVFSGGLCTQYLTN